MKMEIYRRIKSKEKTEKKESTKENNSNECRREKNTVSDFFIS